jgi:hypothetical protein
MRGMDEGRGVRRAMVGLLFIAAGLVFGLDRLGTLDLGRLQDWWPALVILFGLSRMVLPTHRDSIGSGVSWALVGTWMLMVEQGWYGLTWRNSWPLLFVATGAGMVVKALTPAPTRDPMGGPGTGGPGAGGVTS